MLNVLCFTLFLSFLSECIFNQSGNSVDPDQIWIQQNPADFYLNILNKSEHATLQ